MLSMCKRLTLQGDDPSRKALVASGSSSDARFKRRVNRRAAARKWAVESSSRAASVSSRIASDGVGDERIDQRAELLGRLYHCLEVRRQRPRRQVLVGRHALLRNSRTRREERASDAIASRCARWACRTASRPSALLTS